MSTEISYAGENTLDALSRLIKKAIAETSFPDDPGQIVFGTDKHDELKNRDLPDQHPIDAIEGLSEALDGIAANTHQINTLRESNTIDHNVIRESVANLATDVGDLSDLPERLNQIKMEVDESFETVRSDIAANSDAIEALKNVEAPSISAGDGISIENDIISVKTPVRGIISQAEYDALPEDKKIKGLYVVPGGESDGGDSGTRYDNVYSTEEVRIGTWIDKRPLYRRTWKVGPITFTGSYTFEEDFNSNLYSAKDIRKILNGKDQLPLINITANNESIAAYDVIMNAAGLHLSAKSTMGSSISVSNAIYEITIEYTKLADQPEVSA